MSNSRNSWNDELSSLREELKKYKSALTTALKQQAGLRKQLKNEIINQTKEKQIYAAEKNILLQQIEQLNAYIEKLSAHAEQLELNLINSQEQIKTLTTELQQLASSSSATIENKPAITEIENTTKPAETVISTQQKLVETMEPKPAPIVSSSYSIFNPWRILGFKNQETTPMPISEENQVHTSLVDLTQASVDEALAANNHSPSLHK